MPTDNTQSCVLIPTTRLTETHQKTGGWMAKAQADSSVNLSSKFGRSSTPMIVRSEQKVRHSNLAS